MKTFFSDSVKNSRCCTEPSRSLILVQTSFVFLPFWLSNFTKKGFFPQFWTEPEIPSRIKEFVRRVVPEKFRKGDLVSDRGRILVNEEYLTADEILKTDKLFKIMRVD